jgi:hypothetical protein
MFRKINNIYDTQAHALAHSCIYHFKRASKETRFIQHAKNDMNKDAKDRQRCVFFKSIVALSNK